ncbi:Probable methyltransferase PMT27 [Striga hermonthica]|uniref:Methyltransferase n=1 Tax=Striga hermonthica TaxID=68872 RepID=A0A9N7N8Y0_STRHE|nr:Probable methyltransferase PMT27 [Striga hermonthica]
MASGKLRSNKRSSATSTSTTTIIIFIPLSLLLLWLLTSNTLSPTPSPSRPAAATKTPNPVKPISRSQKPETHHVDHEDIPTHLPTDDNDNEKEESDDPKDEQSNSNTNPSNNDNKETNTENNEKSDDQSNSNTNPSNNNDQEMNTENNESTTTAQSQEGEEIRNGPEDTGVQETGAHEITDKDQRERIDEHQRQEDEQMMEPQKKDWESRDPRGAISRDQIEHDEAPVDESSDDTQKPWSTQADESVHEKERRRSGWSDSRNSSYEYTWRLCNATAGADYIPCLDNEKVISKIHNRKHHEHRERHCPEPSPDCLVPLPKGYKTRIDWPQSRDKIWYHNVPHTTLAEVKGHQNWVKMMGEFLTFPGGGTQFIHGALHYIDFLQEAVPDIGWGKHSRVVLDVGCGVASFGGYLFERDVLAMSFAPKDEHEAQVQMALERGIPAISAVMGSQRLPFPSRVFDIVHCARCRVPWHADGYLYNIIYNCFFSNVIINPLKEY